MVTSLRLLALVGSLLFVHYYSFNHSFIAIAWLFNVLKIAHLAIILPKKPCG